MRSGLFCIVLLLSLSFTSAYLSLRDSTNPHVNDFTHNFALDDPSGAYLNLNAPTRLLFPDPDNTSGVAVGEVLFQCVPGAYPQYDPNTPIEITVNLQRIYQINDVFVWIGVQGTNPTVADYTQWTEGSTSAGNGVTFVNTSLNAYNSFERNITLGALSSILNNADGTPRTCFRVVVYVVARRYCGFSHRPGHLTYSPPGCDTSYSAIYPSNSSYFTVGVNHEEYPEVVNNGTTFYEGYCLTPTRDIDPNYGYTGQVYSSYDPEVLSSSPGDFVEVPAALPLINYLINHEAEYKSTFLSGYQCTWQDIQYVIWIILNPSVPSTDPIFYQLLTNSTAECRDWIYHDVETNGQNYVPPCPGGKFLLILFPVMNKNTCEHNNNTQVIAFPTGGSCLNRCQPKQCEDVLRTSGRFCLTGQCAPLPSASTSNLPIVPSQSSAPSYTSGPSQSSSPEASCTSRPSRSESSVPSQSRSTYASRSESSVPSQSRTTHSSRSQSSVPSQSRSTYASRSESSVPSQSRTTHSSRSQSSVPSQSRTTYASRSESSVPSQSRTSYSSRSQSSVPSQSRSTYASRSNLPIIPSETCTSHPSHSPAESCTSRPSRSESSVPSQSRTTYASRSESSVPSQSRTTYASRSESSVPSQSRTSYSSRSQSSVPSQSRSTHPSTTSLPIIPSETCTSHPSHSSEASCSSRPSHSPAESCTSHPSHSPAESCTSHPSHSRAPAESCTSHPSHSRAPAESCTSHPSHSRAPAESCTSHPSHSPAESCTSHPSHSPAASCTSHPSQSRAPVVPSHSASNSAPCHQSASPSRSAPCHDMGTSASPSKSAPCHNMGSPSASASPCDRTSGGHTRP